MREMIFSNAMVGDTRRFRATIDVEQAQIRFLGDLVLNLWDCGGQESESHPPSVSSQLRPRFSDLHCMLRSVD